MTKRRFWFLPAIFLLAACEKNTAQTNPGGAHRFPLADARHGFTTKLVAKHHTGEPVPTPPPGVFNLVE